MAWGFGVCFLCVFCFCFVFFFVVVFFCFCFFFLGGGGIYFSSDFTLLDSEMKQC